MRELTLGETGFLATVLLFSLVGAVTLSLQAGRFGCAVPDHGG